MTDDYDQQADSIGSYEDAIGAMRVKHVASQRVRVIQGNCLAEVPRLVAEGVVVDSIVCDPPYHLVAIAERSKYKIKHGKDGAMKRLLSGFMGTTWDGGDIAFRPETWATLATILRPGGFLLAFGGTRTWHRLTCAIEDAGFVIQDTLMWLYGSGFPKRRDMLKPAWEPIIMAYKPAGKRTMQVDECRIPAETRPAFKYFDTGCKSGYSGGIKGGAQIGEHDLGRWPANVCHDGSDEVMEAFAAFGESKSGQPRERSDSRARQSGFHMTAGSGGFGDAGTAARFFYCATPICYCQLCQIRPIDAPSAELSSSDEDTENHAQNHFAPNDALAYLPLEGEVKNSQSSECAPSVASRSSKTHQPINGFAEKNALRWPLEKIAQNVRSAASLCSLCAIAIAQELVAAGQNESVGSSLSKLSMYGSTRTILCRSLAQYVAGRENTDIILTTASLRELFGSVFHAIAENINSAKSDRPGKCAQKRLWYGGKADHHDRWGSKHPTVKPAELMKWLVPLVTPKSPAIVLDPFAGSGTTGVAALATSRNAILIEQDETYCADIRERIAHYDGTGRHSLVSRNRNKRAGVDALRDGGRLEADAQARDRGLPLFAVE